jgi:hypothetical protein
MLLSRRDGSPRRPPGSGETLHRVNALADVAARHAECRRGIPSIFVGFSVFRIMKIHFVGDDKK